MKSDQSASSPPVLEYRTSPPRRAPEHLRVKLIVIDVLIICAITFIGGIVAGFIVPLTGNSNFWLFAGISNFVFATLAFTLAGMRAPNGNRWPHLMLVAAMVWLTGLLNVAINNFSFVLWVFSLAFVGLWMVLGGLISMRIKRHT